GDVAYVAIADDRDTPCRLHNCPNAIQIDVAAKALLARSAVNGHGTDAGLLELAGKEGCTLVVFVPAQAHLDGHWNANCLNHRSHKADGRARAAHQRRAAAAAAHFVHGAAHVDVHD